MNYKKSLFLLLWPFLFLSCEKDDVCIGATTPDLIGRFYDFNLHTPKPTTDFTLIALPQQDTLYKEASIDSILLPLDTQHTTTKYVFIEGSNPDTLKISYDLNPHFVSKACGYIMYFDNLNIQISPDNDLWIKQIEILQNTINIDTSAHVKIYH